MFGARAQNHVPHGCLIFKKKRNPENGRTMKRAAVDGGAQARKKYNAFFMPCPL
jgi:hypothetical protein